MPVPEIPKKEKPLVDITNCTPLWMVTMGDSMSLLLCFFVMMLNFGSIHSEELMNIVGAFSGGREIMRPSAATAKESWHRRKDAEIQPAPVLLRLSDIPRRLQDTERRLAASGFERHIAVKQLEAGILVRIDDQLLFDSPGKLAPAGERALRDIVNLLEAVGNEVRLRADMDDGEAAGEAHARSAAVAAFLMTQGAIDRRRVGFAARSIEAPDSPRTFEIMLMESPDTRQLGFSDLWNREEWQR